LSTGANAESGMVGGGNGSAEGATDGNGEGTGGAGGAAAPVPANSTAAAVAAPSVTRPRRRNVAPILHLRYSDIDVSHADAQGVVRIELTWW